VRLHENIVNLLGVCKSPHIAIVSEFIEMGSLDRLLPTLRLEIEDIVRIARATAAGIFYLHSNNVIHRCAAFQHLLIVLPLPVQEHSQCQSL
jgi:serine/threonine protein kinase